MTTALDEVAQRQAIRELYASYCFYVDVGRADLFAASFTEDGVLWLSDRGSYVGREEIEAHVGRRSGKTFHLIHNVVVTSLDDQAATSHAYFQLLNPDDATTVAYGTYDDLLRRVDDRWRWHRKKVNYQYRSEEYAELAKTMRRPDFGQDLDGVPAFADVAETSGPFAPNNPNDLRQESR